MENQVFNSKGKVQIIVKEKSVTFIRIDEEDNPEKNLYNKVKIDVPKSHIATIKYDDFKSIKKINFLKAYIMLVVGVIALLVGLFILPVLIVGIVLIIFSIILLAIKSTGKKNSEYSDKKLIFMDSNDKVIFSTHVVVDDEKQIDDLIDLIRK